MKFRTKIQISKQDFKIDHSKNIFFIGSCFTDNIGKILNDYKFNNIVNPFGVLYNPESVANNLKMSFSPEINSEPELRKSGDLWFDYRFHGSFSDINKNLTETKIINAISKTSKFIQITDYLFITWGTSWIYRLKENNKTVANCHKQKPDLFTREKLSSDYIFKKYSVLFEEIKKINPDLKIVLTVSPVRHLKDGFVENQRSKAELILAAEMLEREFNDISYFPSYEVLIDDLRDYRFYNNDMVHPSQAAVEYLWELFSDTYFDNETKNLNKKIKKINSAFNHRLQFPESKSSKDFANTHLSMINDIKKQNPGLDFENELEYFKKIVR